jgi:hypothetical protein
MSQHMLGKGLCLLLASAPFFFAPYQAIAQSTTEIPLKARRITPDAATTQAFILGVRASPNGLHGYALLSHPPLDLDRRTLATRGVTLLNRLTRYAYIVYATSAAALTDTAVSNRVKGFSLQEPGDRIEPAVRLGNWKPFSVREASTLVGNSVLNSNGTLNVMVWFHKDVSKELANTLLASTTSQRKIVDSAQWEVVTTAAAIQSLTLNDAVRWIDGPRPSGGRDIDHVRQQIHVTDVQGMAGGVVTGLTGAGIRVGLYDEGIDTQNKDFYTVAGITRRIDGGQTGVTWHGNAVGGIIAGNGIQSSVTDNWNKANGGGGYQWQGIAPLAELIDAKPIYGSFTPDGPTLRKHIVTDGLDLSNHSYWLMTDGLYDEKNRLHDNLIRGDDAGDGLPIPARLHVHSAGNFGVDPEFGNQRGYFSLGSQLKNALVVGNYWFDGGRVNRKSSLGPTYDGRIKPDVVAPGSYVMAPGYCTNTDNPGYYETGTSTTLKHPCDNKPPGKTFPRRNFYFQNSGGSVATAVVSGAIALVLQEFVNQGEDLDLRPPLPSTLRAIAIHSASDRNNSPEYNTEEGLPVKTFPGPDFATGFGLIDAAAAVYVVRSHAIKEDVIDATCVTKTYSMFVPAGVDSIKVTLAWDDPASEAVLGGASDQPLLLNDLDLVLIDPAGNKHYPWLLNQMTLDGTTSAPLGNDAQLCGANITTQPQLKPTLAPDLGVVDDPIAVAAIVKAGFGKDHLNNVEQVVAAKIAGVWTVEVSGFMLEKPPQKFSLIGVPPVARFEFHPILFCQNFKAFCTAFKFQSFCRKHPSLCHGPDYIVAMNNRLTLNFRSAGEPKILSYSRLCYALAANDACASGGNTQELALGPGAELLRIEVFDAAGHSLGRDVSNRGTKRLRIRRPASGEALVVIMPDAAVSTNVDHVIPIVIRP